MAITVNGQHHYEYKHSYGNQHSVIVSTHSTSNHEVSQGNGEYHVNLEAATLNHDAPGKAHHPTSVLESHHSQATQKIQEHHGEGHIYDYDVS